MSGSSGGTQNAPVRIGVVGLGAFGRLHALTLAGLSEARLVALVARRQAGLDGMAADLPGIPGWLDLDRAMAESDAEAWVIAASTASHVPLAERLLAGGLPILVEKPLASSLAEAQRLAELVAADSHNLMMGHILLFNSEFRALQAEALRRGRLTHIACTRHRPVTTLGAYPGEDPFHLLMVHDLYTVLALTGRREPTAFSAQARRSAAGACDLALAQLRWDDGLVAALSAGYLTPVGMPADGFDRLEVYGEGWAARVEANPRPFTVWDDRARAPLTLEVTADPRRPTGMLAEELRAFCHVVRGQQTVSLGATYADALRILGWLDRLAQAAGGD